VKQTSNLRDAAFAAMEQAYAPYSNFHVGAALRTSTGETITGCNVENASFPLSVCAEHVALARAVAMGYRDFTEIAIATDAERPTPPCGGCRQVLGEFAPNLIVCTYTKDGRDARWTLRELLPEVFVFDASLGKV
jgi:cytidine deaminase